MGLLGSGCSGTVVAQRFVLTAAFCLYDVKNQKFYDNLDFFPAINGKEMPVGSVKWKDVYIPKGFAKDGALEYDFGLVVLDQPIGDQVGWMGFTHLEDFGLKQATLTGYPWDGVPPQTSWQSTCDINAAEANFLFYKCPGEGKVLAAMTGSPIWYKGQQDTDWYIVGVHNYAQDDKLNSWWALRLNQANTETLLAWIDEANKGTGGGGGKTEEEDTGDDKDTGDDEEDTGGEEDKDCSCDDN
jgi:V8-like Glu-specific endopeptidase